MTTGLVPVIEIFVLFRLGYVPTFNVRRKSQGVVTSIGVFSSVLRRGHVRVYVRPRRGDNFGYVHA